MLGRLAGVFSLLVLMSAAARAADIQITPVRVELSPAAPRASIVVRNLSEERLRLELTVSSWDQTPQGETILGPAPELVVFPPLLELGPKESRKFRLSAKGGFGELERSFRLFVQELPGGAKPGEKQAVKFVSRFGIPVYLAPPAPTLRLTVDEVAYAAGHLRWQVRNVGNLRLAPASLEVKGLDAKGGVVFAKTIDSWYVLAGGVRAFDFPIPVVDCARVRKLTIELPAGKIPVRTGVETPGGACGP